MTKGHCESSLGTFNELQNSAQAAVDPQTEPPDLGCELSFFDYCRMFPLLSHWTAPTFEFLNLITWVTCLVTSGLCKHWPWFSSHCIPLMGLWWQLRATYMWGRVLAPLHNFLLQLLTKRLATTNRSCVGFHATKILARAYDVVSPVKKFSFF